MVPPTAPVELGFAGQISTFISQSQHLLRLSIHHQLSPHARLSLDGIADVAGDRRISKHPADLREAGLSAWGHGSPRGPALPGRMSPEGKRQSKDRSQPLPGRGTRGAWREAWWGGGLSPRGPGAVGRVVTAPCTAVCTCAHLPHPHRTRTLLPLRQLVRPEAPFRVAFLMPGHSGTRRVSAVETQSSNLELSHYSDTGNFPSHQIVS